MVCGNDAPTVDVLNHSLAWKAHALAPCPIGRTAPEIWKMESDGTRVFISYSHADRRWLNRLQVHLRPLERLGTITLWDDTRIKAGSHWREEIERELDRARGAILLVSADFLASDFITTNELPRLLAAAEQRGTLILSVIISPCRFEQTRALSRFQAVNPPSQPLVRMGGAGREEVFVALADRIEAALQGGQPVAAPILPVQRPEREAPVHSQTPSSPSRETGTPLYESAVNREVAFEDYVLRELVSGTIEVMKNGAVILPAKPVLRRLASRLGVALLNAHGNPRNTRQLGSELIKKLGG